MLRGYTIAHSEEGEIYKSSKDMNSGMDFKLKFHDGDVACKVVE